MEICPDLSDAEIKAYWTPERMATAEPKELKQATIPRSGAEAIPSSDEQVNIAGAKNGERTELDLAPVLQPKERPWCRVGKLYFTLGRERHFFGTAFAIHDNTLLTAAHNIREKNSSGVVEVYERFIFYPAPTPQDPMPFGSWTYQTTYVMGDWVSYLTTPELDFGVIRLNEGGKEGELPARISSVGGYFGLKYNQPLTSSSKWRAVGYPGTKRQMYFDEGSYTDCNEYPDGGKVVFKNGKLFEGASGGPWLLNDNYVNGIYIGAVSETEGASPYFDSRMENFINRCLP